MICIIYYFLFKLNIDTRFSLFFSGDYHRKLRISIGGFEWFTRRDRTCSYEVATSVNVGTFKYVCKL